MTRLAMLFGRATRNPGAALSLCPRLVWVAPTVQEQGRLAAGPISGEASRSSFLSGERAGHGRRDSGAPRTGWLCANSVRVNLLRCPQSHNRNPLVGQHALKRPRSCRRAGTRALHLPVRRAMPSGYSRFRIRIIRRSATTERLFHCQSQSARRGRGRLASGVRDAGFTPRWSSSLTMRQIHSFWVECKCGGRLGLRRSWREFRVSTGAGCCFRSAGSVTAWAGSARGRCSPSVMEGSQRAEGPPSP